MPKAVYVSNMKARKAPKEKQEEFDGKGMGKMFNEPLSCKSKKDCETGQIGYGEKGAKVCGSVEDAKEAGKAKGDKRRADAAAASAAAQDVNLSNLPTNLLFIFPKS